MSLRRILFSVTLLACGSPNDVVPPPPANDAAALGAKVKFSAPAAPLKVTDPNHAAFMQYVAANPNVDFITPEVLWSDVETSADGDHLAYDFAALDQELAQVVALGKKFSLIVAPVSYFPQNHATPKYVLSQAWASKNGQASPVDVCFCQSGYAGNPPPANPNTCLRDGSNTSGLPIVYEPAFKAAYQAFIAQVVNHYGASCQDGYAGVGPACATQSLRDAMGYIRFGLSMGGEGNWACYNGAHASTTFSAASGGPADGYQFSFDAWTKYVPEMESFIASLHPSMWIQGIMGPMTGDSTFTVPHAEAAAAAGSKIGFGTQSLQKSDITDFASNQPCGSTDWCHSFAQYADQAQNLELQTLSCSSPINDACAPGEPLGLTGSLTDLIPFARARGVTILELYPIDFLLAFDPGYVNDVGAHADYAPYASAYAKAISDAHDGL